MVFWTYPLTTGTFTIDASNNAMFLSIICDPSAGSCTVLGSIPFKGISPAPVTLTAGEGINLTAQSPTSPLSGIVITHVAGTVDLLVGF